MPTNYINQDDFKLIIDCVDSVIDANNKRGLGNRGPEKHVLKAALYVQYCGALRVSEMLQLEKDDFNFDRNIITLRKTKTGFKKKDGVKIRKLQFTSIPPDFPPWVKSWIVLAQKGTFQGLLFPFTRQLMHKYFKELCLAAGLDIAEQQEERYIIGGFTHMIRKSRAILMDELGAKENMIAVKLRHKFTVTQRYTKPDINKLIKWEKENIK